MATFQQASLFPEPPAAVGGSGDPVAATTLALVPAAEPERLPVVAWTGPSTAVAGVAPGAVASLVGAGVAGRGGTALLPEMSAGRFSRPGLRGFRAGVEPGRGWTTAFVVGGVAVQGDRLVVRARDDTAGLDLVTEVQTLPGGSLRARHTLTNTAPAAAGDYVVAGLEVAFAVPERVAELLDSTGSHLHERTPQRRPVADGVWLRENRRGKTGLDAASVLHAGTAGFDFGTGEVWAVTVAWSGNSVLAFERDPAVGCSLWGGELLLPGEVVLGAGESYRTPWVHLVAVDDGLDGVAAAFHGYLRSLPAHPAEPVPVTLNVWEAVYFDHDLARLTELAELAAEVGVERYVLDDGWFGARRDDTAGLGDWTVSPRAWPRGLGPLVDRVRGLGMQFGLWFEPEMVNPDSDLFRAHPDWVLCPSGRLPLLERGQLVLDLSRDEVRRHVVDSVSAVLSEYGVDYVKWDHNRDLLEPGSSARGGAAAVSQHTQGFYAVLDELRARHPSVQWESCASGGGRVDLEVLARVQRVWTSDMTDALSRQQIQRWTVQLAAPEYLGAHVSAPVNHQTGRALELDFRAATALFGAFGVEWDLTSAPPTDRRRLAQWIAYHREHRFLLHGGRVFRRDDPDPSVVVHGVVSTDRSTALVAVVVLDDSHRRGPVTVRVPGLEPRRPYTVSRGGPDGGESIVVGVAGAALATVGLSVPRGWPQTVALLEVRAG